MACVSPSPRTSEAGNSVSVIHAFIAVAVLGVLIVLIGYFRVRRALQQQRGLDQHEGWDEMMVKRLRADGYRPFNEYQVDFFLALKGEADCEAVRARLEPEGFAVDVKPMQDGSDLPFSLHASKAMKLLVPDIQAVSRHMNALAEEFQGRYDRWAA